MAQITKDKKNKLDTRKIFDDFEKHISVYLEKERLLLEKLLVKLGIKEKRATDGEQIENKGGLIKSLFICAVFLK